MMQSRIRAAEEAAAGTIDPRRHHWYALRVQPQKERLTRLLLTERGFPAWTPLEHRRERASRYTTRIARRRRPLLVGYVLAGLPGGPDARDRALAMALGISTVTGIVTSDGRPQPLARREVEHLMLVDQGEIVALPKPGERMLLVDGPLAAHPLAESCMVDLRAINGTQARILVGLLGGIEIEVPLDRLATP